MAADRGFEEALAVSRLFGEHGALWITDHIRTSSVTGNKAGARKYARIASMYQKIMKPADGAVIGDQAEILPVV